MDTEETTEPQSGVTPESSGHQTEELPKSCKQCERWHEIKERIRVSEVLASVIEKIKGKLEAEDFKPTVADLLKLVDAEKNLEQEDFENDGAKEVKVTVTWLPDTSSEK